MKKNIIIVSIALASIFLFASFFFKNSTNIKDYEVVEKDNIGTTTTAIMANGCFWCAEADFEKLNGVKMVVSGYSGGSIESPSYSNYSSGGHREVVEITYDPKIVSYSNLVLYLIKHGDPTDGNGSFYDRGLEYAPAVYYDTEQEKSEALKVISDINAQKIYTKPLELVVIPRTKFYPAEDYHQDYYKKNPLKYGYYRNGSGRDAFIKKYWGENTGVVSSKSAWTDFKKPSEERLRSILTPIQYKVTQQNGTETPFANEYDKNDKEGIYVDIVSGEPLYSSKDKYDSGTGWPSFVKPIYSDAVVLKEDFGIFGNRIEVRSKYADSHLGHVFNDGPVERGGKRYCMNSAALRFIPKDMMEKEGYGEYVRFI